MKAVFRLVVFSPRGEFASELTAMGASPFYTIVAEVAEPAQLAQIVDEQDASGILVDLAADAETLMAVVSGVAASRAGLVVIGASAAPSTQAVMSAMRMGFADYLDWPTDVGLLAETVNRLSQRDGEVPRGRVVSIIGTNGGVGCSMLAVNLAVELAASSGQKAAVVDLDFRYGQCATLLDIKATHTIAGLYKNRDKLDEQMVQRAMTRHSSGVDVLARPAEFKEAFGLQAGECVYILGVLQQLYRYIVVDGPSRSDSSGRPVLDLAEWLFVLTLPQVPPVRSAKRVVRALADHKFNVDRLGVVLNRSGQLGGLSDERVEESLGVPLRASIPDDPKSVGNVVNLGEPLATGASRSKARLAIQSLAQSLLQAAPVAGDSGQAGGLFGRFFRFGSGRGKVEAPDSPRVAS